MAKNSLLDKSAIDFLSEYVNNAAPTGFESSGQKRWLEYIKPYIDDHYIDIYGTCVGIVNPEAEFKVVIEAHADEISWFVNYITDDGFIYVRRNGGSDHQIAPSKQVILHADKGAVNGVFGWPAIHTRRGPGKKEDPPKVSNIFIDVGCSSKEEVENLGIYPGTVVTFNDPFQVLNDRYFCGRALDNRIGGFMIAQVAKLLKKNDVKLPFGLYIVNAVQEEVGLRGAQMIAEYIKPDVAIVTDVCHDTQTPNIDKIVEGDTSAGKGPVLTYGPAVQQNLLKLIIETSEAENISFQRRSSSRATGTDTDAFAYSGSGVASALISLPLRYMHTTVEMCHKDDVENLIRLIYYALQKIKDNHDFRYFS